MARALAPEGLDAIEVFHPDHDPQQEARLGELVNEPGLAMTAGSDFHGTPEGRKRPGGVAGDGEMLGICGPGRAAPDGRPRAFASQTAAESLWPRTGRRAPSALLAAASASPAAHTSLHPLGSDTVATLGLYLSARGEPNAAVEKAVAEIRAQKIILPKSPRRQRRRRVRKC